MNVADKLQKHIKDKNVKQLPTWVFIGRNVGFWALYVIFALLGAKAVGIILYSLTETDFELLSAASEQGEYLWLQMLPVIWIACFVAFFAVAYYGARHVKGGYKRKGTTLILTNIIISLTVGSVSYATGAAEQVDELVEVAFPVYHSIQHQREDLWSMADKGRLAGIIIEVSPEEDEVLMLQDKRQEVWSVNYKEAMTKPGLEVTEGVHVRMLGSSTGDYEFEARVIAPFRMRGPVMDKVKQELLRRGLHPDREPPQLQKQPGMSIPRGR